MYRCAICKKYVRSLSVVAVEEDDGDYTFEGFCPTHLLTEVVKV